MIKWIKNMFRNQDIDELAAELENIYSILDEIEAKQQAHQAEIWEYISGTLEPLKKRAIARMGREEQKDLNTTPTRSGMMRGSSHGLVK